jgi:diguanylate cyclase (GGDEF)-like protein
VGPAAFFIFTMRFIQRDQWLKPGVLALFAVEPVLTLILLWTDPATGWFFAGQRALTSSTILNGSSFFWIHVGYTYLLLLVPTVLLVQRALRTTTYYRWQMLLTVAALALPWAINIASLLHWLPWADLDATPIAFTITGLTILYSMLGWGFLDILPIAHDLLIESMNDGVLILDSRCRLVEHNTQGAKLLSSRRKGNIGEPVESLLEDWPPAALALIQGSPGSQEIHLDREPPLYLELHNQPIADRAGRLIGQLVIWHDITIRKTAELALLKANVQLKEQVREIEALQSKMREQAISDGLTGAFNRRYLDETLERELARARRAGDSLAAIMIDIDYFKSVNDQYGHQTGDRVLQQITKLLQRDIRASDILCRYGGDEFLIILLGANAATAAARAESWRQAVEQTSFESANRSFSVTASFGIAIFPDHKADIDGLIQAADEALYSAKSAGRNGVAIYL